MFEIPEYVSRKKRKKKKVVQKEGVRKKDVRKKLVVTWVTRKSVVEVSAEPGEDVEKMGEGQEREKESRKDLPETQLVGIGTGSFEEG